MRRSIMGWIAQRKLQGYGYAEASASASAVVKVRSFKYSMLSHAL